MTLNYTPLKINEDSEQEASELQQVHYTVTPRFNDWVRLYTTKNTPTYGNATQAAIVAYKLDPVRQYTHASVMGSRNIRKASHLGRNYMESKGLNIFTMLDFAAKQMLEAREGKEKWWDRIVMITGMQESAKQIVNNQFIGTQNNTQTNISITPEQQKEFNDKFMQFVDEQPQP